MVFNFRGFLRFLYLWLSGSGWTPRRIAILVAFFLFFPLLEIFVWVGLLFDNIRYPNYRREVARSPVFIIGNPRSGTTFLHRLLSRDIGRFSTMQMWEILIAPSITQRKVIEGLAAAFQRFGDWISAKLTRIEKGWHAKNVMHAVSLREPEEDDYLLLHIWSALTIGLSAGILQEARPYTYFDLKLPERQRERIMAFYRRCVQRHLHADRVCRSRTARQYLAKNPALSPKVDTVIKYFPDVKFVVLVRNPLEVIPSYVSMMMFSWRILGIPVNDHRLRDYITDMAYHWYRYPLERLEKAPAESTIIIRYDEMICDPGRTVEKIYAQFGFEMSPEFAAVLSAETTRSRRYKSRHRYALHELGLSREMILSKFQSIFDRFGFDQTVGKDRNNSSSLFSAMS